MSRRLTIEEGRAALARAAKAKRSYTLAGSHKKPPDTDGVTKATSEQVMPQLHRSGFKVPDTLKKR